MEAEKSTFWPDDDGRAAVRLGRAFVLAPLIMGCLATLVAFLISGMSEPTQEGVMDVTLTTAMTLVPAMFVFMLTFGAAGVFGLWYLSQRGLFAWAVAGALAGTLASLVFGEFLMGRVERPMLIAAAVGGWILFLLFRWIAGIRSGERPQRSE